MRGIKVLVTTLLLAVVCTAAADIIHLKSGRRIEAEGVRVEGEKVVFTVFGGQMTIHLTAVEKIVKTSGPVAANAGLRNAVSGTAFRGVTPVAAGEGGDSAGQNTQELVAFYIQQRQQLIKEIRLYDEQVQTLRSVVFAKSAIFEGTDTERNRITNLENMKRAAEQKLKTLMDDARKAGLGPGDLRAIEDARSATGDAPTTSIENQRDSRDANVTWIDINNADDDGRNSDVVLTEDDDDNRSTDPAKEEEAKKKKK